jgi:hypothetical protein
MNGHEMNGTAPILTEGERLELEDDLKKVNKRKTSKQHLTKCIL